jgi:outer membrane protein, heavy metal efflux system
MKLRTILLVCVQYAVLAQPDSTNRIVLTPALINGLAEEARTNNSALWAARSRIAAAEENAKSIPIWRDPEIMIGGMAAERMMREEDGDIMYGIEQPLPVFGKERAARRVAQAEISVEEADLEYRFQTLRKSVAEALFKAVLTDEELAVAQDDLIWLNTLVTSVEQRYQAGNASQVDVLRVQNQRSQRVEQLRNAENNREVAYVTVNRLLNRNLYSAWARMELPAIAEPIPFSDRLLVFATKFEPKLRMMRRKAESARKMVELSQKEKRPDLSVAVEGRQYSRTGEGRSAAVLLKLSLPWLNSGKYQAAIRREQARAQEIDNEIEDMTFESHTEVHHLIARIDNARREALLYRDEILPRSRQALASAEAAWESSRDAFRDVLDSRRMLLEASLMYFRAVAEQYMGISELVLCCGVGDLESLEMITKGRANQPKEDK